MDRKKSKMSIDTLVNILVPEEIGVPLIPLRQVEIIELTYFRVLLFLSILSGIVTAILSFLSIGYNNNPFIGLLVIFAAIFFVISIVFVRRLLNMRLGIFKQKDFIKAKGKKSSTGFDSASKLFLAMYFNRGMFLLRDKIFVDGYSVEESKFADLWKGELENKYGELYDDYFNLFLQVGILRKRLVDKSTVIEFDPKFNPDDFFEVMIGLDI